MPRQVQFTPNRMRSGRAELALAESNFAKEVGGLVIQQEQQAQGRMLSSALSELDVKTEELRVQHELDPEGFDRDHQAYFEGAASKMPGAIQERYLEAADRSRRLARLDIDSAVKKDTEEKDRRAFSEGYDTLLKQSLKAAREGSFDALGARQDLDDLLTYFGTSLSEAEISNILSDFDDATVREATLGAFESAEDQGDFLARYAERTDIPIDEQQEMLATMGGIMSQAEDVREIDEAEEIAQAAYQRTLAASTLAVMVDAGQASYKDVDHALHGNIINDGEHRRLYRVLAKGAEEKVDKARALAAVSRALNSGEVIDWKDNDHKDALDEVMLQGVGSFSELSDGGRTAAAEMVGRAGVVPDSLRSHLRTHLRHADPEVAATAADFMAKIEEASAEAVADLPKDERAFAEVVTDSIKAGMDPTLAVELGRENVFAVTQSEREARKIKYIEDYEEDNADFLWEAVDDWGSTPDVPVAFQTEFNDLTKQYFGRTKDIESARNLALKDVQSVWGQTDFGMSDESFVKYPVERMYDMPKDEIERQFKRDTLDQDVFLVADPKTARQGKNAASWVVMLRNENGLPEPVRDTDNTPFRWAPDMNEYQESVAKEIAAEQQRKTIRRKLVGDKFREAFSAPDSR